MPKKWAEVESNPAYQSLDPEKKAKAQEQYFNQVVAPAVGPAKVEAARSQFMARANKSPIVPAGPSLEDKAMSLAQGAQVVGGIGAPIAAIASGAPAAPILGGLAGATIAGAGAHALMDATGAAPALKGAAEKVRSVLPEPKFGGDLGVLKNFVSRAAEEFTPPGMLANALEFAPQLAEAYAGMRGGQAGGAIGAGAKNLLLGTPKVPQGQEGSAFLNTVNEAMGTPKVPVQDKMQMGDLYQGMENTRGQIGKQQGDIKEFAFKSADAPENVPATLNTAIQKALADLGVKPGKEGLSKSPEAVKALLKISKQDVPKATDLTDMDTLRGRLAGMGESARSPNSPTSQEAPFYEGASKAIKNSIEAQIPSGAPKDALNTANKAYHTMLELEKMGYKMGTSGDFNPARALAVWKEVTPTEKARLDPDAVRALDELLTQKSQGVLNYFVNVVKKLPNVGPTVDAALNPSKQPVRFNAPEQKLTPEMARALGISQGAVGLIPSMFK